MFAVSEVPKGAGCVADVLLALYCTSCCSDYCLNICDRVKVWPSPLRKSLN